MTVLSWRFYTGTWMTEMGFRLPEGLEVLSLLCNTVTSSEIQTFTHAMGAAVSITDIQLIWELILTLTSK